jgi:hypothetical protein
MQLTAFGARDRGYFDIRLCSTTFSISPGGS